MLFRSGGAGGGAGAATPSWLEHDFDIVDDIVHSIKKKQKTSGSSLADQYRESAGEEIARFIVSVYPLPPSDAYTAIIVPNEVALFQAMRRIQVRFRALVRCSHNGDGFDYIAQRVRLQLLSHAQGPCLWFYRQIGRAHV